MSAFSRCMGCKGPVKNGDCFCSKKCEILFQIRRPSEDECWPWAAKEKSGDYGKHRLVYELFKEPIPPGLVVRHTCDNPPCCNPKHLILGTQADNMRDAVERGRMASGLANGKVWGAHIRRLKECGGFDVSKLVKPKQNKQK